MTLEKTIEVQRQASLAIVKLNRGGIFLFGGYDNTFPHEMYRGAINFLGGGNDETDISPLDVIQREINDEFSYKFDTEEDATLAKEAGAGYEKSNLKEEDLASEEDMKVVKEEILSKMVPYQDFKVHIPPRPKGPVDREVTRLFSVFYSEFSESCYDLILQNFKQGKSLVNEGLLRLVTKYDLTRGNVLTAWATGPIMEYFLGESIPDPVGICIEPIGPPRNSFRDYSEFNFDFPVNQ